MRENDCTTETKHMLADSQWHDVSAYVNAGVHSVYNDLTSLQALKWHDGSAYVNAGVDSVRRQR